MRPLFHEATGPLPQRTLLEGTGQALSNIPSGGGLDSVCPQKVKCSLLPCARRTAPDYGPHLSASPALVTRWPFHSGVRGMA